jgi:transcription antitermination factor NusG
MESTQVIPSAEAVAAPWSCALWWFALTVQHQHEKTVARNLDQAGLESFVPLYRTRRMWSDRVKELELPLFPTYVFSRFAWRERMRVLRIPGVRELVGFGKQATPVPEVEINALKRMVASGLPVHPWPYLKVGDWVLITRGPLRGLEGIVVRHKDAWRVVVSVHLLQRSVAAEVDRLWLSPSTPSSARFALGVAAAR